MDDTPATAEIIRLQEADFDWLDIKNYQLRPFDLYTASRVLSVRRFFGRLWRSPLFDVPPPHVDALHSHMGHAFKADGYLHDISQDSWGGIAQDSVLQDIFKKLQCTPLEDHVPTPPLPEEAPAPALSAVKAFDRETAYRTLHSFTQSHSLDKDYYAIEGDLRHGRGYVEIDFDYTDTHIKQDFDAWLANARQHYAKSISTHNLPDTVQKWFNGAVIPRIDMELYRVLVQDRARLKANTSNINVEIPVSVRFAKLFPERTESAPADVIKVCERNVRALMSDSDLEVRLANVMRRSSVKDKN